MLAQAKNLVYTASMKKDDNYYSQLFAYAYAHSPSYAKLATKLSPDLKGPAVQRWPQIGVPHKWRPILDQKFGTAFRKSLNTTV